MQHHFGHLVNVLHWGTNQVINNALAQMDLTASQGRIMGYLNRCVQPPCARDVEETFQLSHPTVSGILSRLEKKDFIALLPDESDRRIRRIHVRPKGVECHERILAAIRENEQRIVQGFSEDERKQFASLLERAVANMGHSCRPMTKEEIRK